jgi:NAD(P)-dependent dehydrogenase (short-subunit alcohol dehydrogenase family)
VEDFGGKVAVVTGASSGLGRRLSQDLVARGATVVGVARRRELLDELAAELAVRSPESSTAVCDVGDTAAFVRLLHELEDRYGRIDVLVNNAGYDVPTPLCVPDSVGGVDGASVLDAYRRIIDVNLLAAVAGTEAVLPGMLARGSGVVVNVSSDIVRTPVPPHTAYTAAKAALSAFTESTNFEVADRGVRFHVVYPGWMATAMGNVAHEEGIKVPKFNVRTVEQVSKLTLDRMGGPRIEINAVPGLAIAPVFRALLPGMYARMIARTVPPAR